ncbi:MAG: type II toxin-antitoxin system VapC family toxin [Planctomycetia bacterium]|nr:type II toxin-antitoxin system VapC family toxin [Planctomycetia bacterium]
MIFRDIPVGASVFLDANVLVYHFIAHSTFGPSSTELLDRIERKALVGFVSSHVLGELSHRLMTLEATVLFGWPAQGIIRRLKRHPAEVGQLTRSAQALDKLNLIGVTVLPVEGQQVSRAADVSKQFGLLTNDALIIAIMRDHQSSHLASNDADFDRVSGLLRYAPL